MILATTNRKVTSWLTVSAEHAPSQREFNFERRLLNVVSLRWVELNYHDGYHTGIHHTEADRC